MMTIQASQLIQIYNVDWTDVYDTQRGLDRDLQRGLGRRLRHTTLNTQQNQLAIKVSADN